MTYKEAFEALRAEIFKRMNNLCCNGVVANSDKDKYLLLQDLFGYVVSLPVEDGSPSAGKSAGDVFGKEPLQATLDYLEEAKKHYATPDGLTKCQAWVRGLAKKSEAEASDDLDDAAYYFAMDEYGNPKESGFLFNQRCFKAGADWQLRRMTENALGVRGITYLEYWVGFGKRSFEQMCEAEQVEFIEPDNIENETIKN